MALALRVVVAQQRAEFVVAEQRRFRRPGAVLRRASFSRQPLADAAHAEQAMHGSKAQQPEQAVRVRACAYACIEVSTTDGIVWFE